MAYTSTSQSTKSSAKYIFVWDKQKGTRTAKYVRTLTIATSADWRFPATTAIYIFVTDPQTHGPHGPTCKRPDGHTDGRTDRMDTQTGGRTRRSTDADVRTHGCRSTDADARTKTQVPDGARTLNICACSTWVEKSSRHVLRLDERARTFEVYYTTVHRAFLALH